MEIIASHILNLVTRCTLAWRRILSVTLVWLQSHAGEYVMCNNRKLFLPNCVEYDVFPLKPAHLLASDFIPAAANTDFLG
jgi:hypothetical protein